MSRARTARLHSRGGGRGARVHPQVRPAGTVRPSAAGGVHGRLPAAVVDRGRLVDRGLHRRAARARGRRPLDPRVRRAGPPRARREDAWHLWSNHGGTLRPLDDRFPEPISNESQIWVRRSAQDPWVIDLPITPDRDGLWTNKRMPDHVAPLEDVTWVADDGIRYLNPEIGLLYKAVLARRKDDRDLDRCLPLLERGRARVAARQRRPAVSRPRLAGSPLLKEPDGSEGTSDRRTIRPGRTHHEPTSRSSSARLSSRAVVRPDRARRLRPGDRSPGDHRRRRPDPHIGCEWWRGLRVHRLHRRLDRTRPVPRPVARRRLRLALGRLGRLRPDAHRVRHPRGGRREQPRRRACPTAS